MHTQKRALPSPKDPMGYTEKEIFEICRKRHIERKTFWKAFGVNTVAVAKDGTSRFYRCDIEQALWSLGKLGGKPHPWD